MNILIAPDSYKNNMKNTEVISIIEGAIKKEMSLCQCRGIPMADGGEGTSQALIDATGAKKIEVQVSGPLGEKVTAYYGLSSHGKMAFMEMASASGIELIPSSALNPMKASTYGTGELIKAALEAGAEEIIIGIGGSATVDGGAGMAQALGYRLLDSSGADIKPGGEGLLTLESIEESDYLKHKNFRLRIACDVTNPLLGPSGAPAVYGPQKGATEQTIPLLEKGLAQLATLMTEKGWISDSEQPGDGAAGGLGLGLRGFLQGKGESGAALVADVSGFDDALNWADVVVTGEGKTDGQTISGKLCAVLAQKAKAKNLPVFLLSGALGGDPAPLLGLFTAVWSISSGHNSLKDNIDNSRTDLEHTARNLGRLLNLVNS